MKMFVKTMGFAILLAGFGGGAFYACSEDDEVECEAGLVKVDVVGNCKTFFGKICDCNPLPTGVTKAECDLVDQGVACSKPDEVTSDEECKNILTYLETEKVDVCKQDLS